MNNVKPVTDFKSIIDNKTVNTILRPKDAKGIAGFVFDIPDTETLEDVSQITDHYMEDGSFLNDHVVDNPIRITLTGFVGELVAKSTTNLNGIVGATQERISQVTGYLGAFPPGMTQRLQGALSTVQTYFNAANTFLDRSKNLYDSIVGTDSAPTKQEQAYSTLKAMKDSRQMFSVSTPWSYHEDMMIESINVTQGAESSGISSFTVNLKQVRFAEVEYTTFDNNLLPPRTEVQDSEEVNQGKVGGTNVDESILSQAFGSLAG